MLIPALLSLLATTAGPQPDARPNVLVLVGDDISERDMDLMSTPTFDSLAARGLRFRRAYANPTCSPSRWSIQFGQFHAQGAGRVCDGYDPEAAPPLTQFSLPKLFSGAGYGTALFGKWHLGSHPGVNEGKAWEETPQLHGYDTWRAGLPLNIKSCGGKSYHNWLRVDDGHSAKSTEYVPDAIRDAFLGWHAERQASDEPWFAMVCFLLPHTPLHEAPGSPYSKYEKSRRAKYESQVRYLDENLASVLSVVDLESTLVIFLADNGCPQGTPRQGQTPRKVKTTTYEDGIRVPMVWAGAGVASGLETDSLVHVVDLLPTFADLLGVDIDEDGLDGESLLPLLDAPQHAVRDYVWAGLGPNKNAPGGDFAVVTPRYKLRRCGSELQLFDLETDPEESENLAALEEHAELVFDLQAKLERHAERL